MNTTCRHPSRGPARILLALVLCAATSAWTPAAQSPQPVVYTVSSSAPATHVLEVLAAVPTDGRATIEMMMPTWSPGYYVVENYAQNVSDVSARTPDGAALEVTQPQPNRWTIETKGSPSVVLTYHVKADRGFVTSDYVGEDMWTLNGAPTFMMLMGDQKGPYEIHLEVPSGWSAMTSLDPAPDSVSTHWVASSYDELVDSPIAAGRLSVKEFTVAGKPHYLVDVGQVDGFDADRAATDLRKIVQQDDLFWGGLPYKRYVFLNVFRRGGGGLEHKSSTMLTSSAAATSSPAGYLRWLNFVSHEYFHAFNVKRLRPVVLGPFDYEHAPRTPSLWEAEGLTTYFADLFVTRAGLCKTDDFLSDISSSIRHLQTSPGRLVQTLNQASLDVWGQGGSGVGQNPKTTVSYYEKGVVVGFLLDARIRHLTDGRRGLSDVMRLAYERYSGAHGYTPEQFQETAEEVAGANLSGFFHRALDTTQELDYREALKWFGLRFTSTAEDPPGAGWTLEVRPDATPAQKSHLEALIEGDAP
jgi:predicted metalloprotease with PDZ domain